MTSLLQGRCKYQMSRQENVAGSVYISDECQVLQRQLKNFIRCCTQRGQSLWLELTITLPGITLWYLCITSAFYRLEPTYSEAQNLLQLSLFSLVGRPWSKALMRAVQSGQLPVLIWLCEKGELCTMEALRIAMHRNNLPMVKYMVRCGRVLEFDCQPREDNDFTFTWTFGFNNRNLAVKAYVYDTVFGGELPIARIKEAVKSAIDSQSVLALKWWQHKGIKIHFASARQYTVCRHSNFLDSPGVRRLLDWLDIQVQFLNIMLEAILLCHCNLTRLESYLLSWVWLISCNKSVCLWRQGLVLFLYL